MDAVSSLDVASGILALVRFGVEKTSDKGFGIARLEELKIALFEAISHVYLPSPESLALRELASRCIEDCDALLDDIGTALKNHPEGISQSPNTNAKVRIASIIGARLGAEKLEQLAAATTRQAGSIINFRISELGKTMQSLSDARQYAKPEHESRVTSMSQDLDELAHQVKVRSVNPETRAPVSFTEGDIRHFKTRLVGLNDAEDKIFADKIVASLNYDSRPARLDSVPQAHKNSFQWAFDSRLSEWFSSGSGTFWVSGKPGSGKSTFMKFIAKHSRTKELLANWAGSTETLAIAAHFFWIAGTPIQKSWQGLLQSLLFDVFHRHPSVVPLVSPNRWAAAKSEQWQTAAEPWSVTELSAALRSLASAENMPVKMCFFIDGLDEYDSDHTELCNVLLDMADSPNIKMCLSSRPWPVFERSFGGGNKERLDIHELTRNDIREFVSDQLETHAAWSTNISEEAGSEKTALVEKIVAQADGVFLWAFFVTRSLREGLTNGDKITDLHRLLSGLPTDLEQLFKHMLENVDPKDHPQMAGTLQTASHALEPLHIDLYWQMEREFEEHDYAYRCPIGAGSFDLVQKRRDEAMSSINQKTKGLLKLVNSRVEFLHRTVKDFVLTRDMGEYLRGKLPPGYNGFIAIGTAYLGFLKTTRQDHSLVAGIVRQGLGLNSGPFISHLNQALVYASEALKSDSPASNHYHQATTLLDKYEEAVDEMIRIGHITIRGLNTQDCNPRLPFREELLRHNLTPYIAARLQKQPDFFDMFDESPMFAALTPMSLSSGESPAPVTGILDILLRRGEDPNVLPRHEVPGVSDNPSPWVIFARGTMSVFNMLSGPCMFPALRFNDSLDKSIFGLLLSHGADPNRPLLLRKNARTVFSHFLDISLSKFLGVECFDGYLRTLDAFLRAGASLGVPNDLTEDPDAELAVGNLARLRPEEPILASYCTELKGALARLAADPERSRFVSSVTEKLISHCSGNEEYLEQLSLAISEGFPEPVGKPLLELLAGEIELGKQQELAKKRQRESWGGISGSATKHIRMS